MSDRPLSLLGLPRAERRRVAEEAPPESPFAQKLRHDSDASFRRMIEKHHADVMRGVLELGRPKHGGPAPGSCPRCGRGPRVLASSYGTWRVPDLNCALRRCLP